MKIDEALAHFESRLESETDAADLHADLQNGVSGFVVIDARTPESYASGHIPGAVNLPHRTISPETTVWLSKETLVITYCDGIGCNASTKAAVKLSRLGYRVKEMIGGMDWWRRDGFAVATGSETPVAAGIVCGC
jgi:rhodanese-related sulfurtransferase